MSNYSPSLRGIASMLVATASFVANDTCMKLALDGTPPMQVLVMRGVAASTLCLPLLLVLGYGPALRHVRNRWVLTRALAEALAVCCFIVALLHMPLGDITAIAQTSPLLVLLAVSFFWGERIGTVRMVLVILGIAGAVMVAQPGSSTASPFAVIGFLAAAGSAVRDITARKVAPEIPALIVAFATLLTVMTVAVVGLLLFETPVVPTARTLALLVTAGFFLIGGQFFLFLAFRLAPARTVSPFSYAFTVWAVLSGLIVFGVVPNPLALTGMGLILATGLGIIILEGRSRQGETVPVDRGPGVISS